MGKKRINEILRWKGQVYSRKKKKEEFGGLWGQRMDSV